ncbi:MAG: 1-aminocyclopropane-1-carboxylate deaminase/D-cysteine desulfhydrase [Sulfurospirillum sp.]|nr:1-aminocyclopropane-1-carboxylate deaminase/D-cysteine desulfhydrase [Sulfurospirillum sp.]
MQFSPSPLQKQHFRNRDFYLKRDDLLHADFSGNKARKLHYFLSQEYLHVRRVVSYGSNQSNAMYSLSVLARMRGWEFIYFCKQIPSFLQQNPIGNYKAALQNGMKIYQSEDTNLSANALARKDTLVVQEGGRQSEAEFGLKILAQELQDDIRTHHLQNPFVFLPSGTGTTALYLQKYLQYPVFTCSTVADDVYLKKQWQMLEQNEEFFPKILDISQKFHYAKPSLELYKIWSELEQYTHIQYDLIYDVVGWRKLLEYWHTLQGDLIYIHQGGLLGNESMLERYKYKYGIIELLKDEKNEDI